MERVNPFKGPNSYEDGNDFFGRDKEIKEVSGLIRNENLILLFSRSGTGKSSLIKAGLMPQLRKDLEYLPVYIHLYDSLVNTNSTNSISNYVIRRCKEEISKHLEGKEKVKIQFADLEIPDSLFEFVTTTRLSITESSESASTESIVTETEYPIKLLIIFDQFEEIFTHPFNQTELQFLITEIRCIVESQLPEYLNETPNKNFSEIKNRLISKQKTFRILFSFREEYLPQFESLKSEIPFIRYTNSRFRLEAFDPDAAEDVIRKTDNKIPDFIASQIVRNLKINILTNFEKLVVEPFLLSLVCQKIYYDIIDDHFGVNDETIRKIKELVDHSLERFIDEIYNEIAEETKAFIETKLITSDHKRTPFNYDEAVSTFGIGDDINKLINSPQYRLLNKEQFLDSSHIEILHDRLLPALAQRRDARLKRAEEETLLIKQQQLKIESDKKRNSLLSIIGACATTIIIALLVVVFMVKNKQITDMEQMDMFSKANQFFYNNDLRRAYAIYNDLSIKNLLFIPHRINSNSSALTYSDLPGTSNITLANNTIVAVLDSSKTLEIWNIASNTSMKYIKTYRNVKLHAVMANGNYLAMYANKKFILYNAITNRDTTLLLNQSKSDSNIYFSFSMNNRFLLFSYGSGASVFDLNNNMKSIGINEQLTYPIELKNILSVSGKIIYSAFYISRDSANYLIKWNRNKDTINMDATDLITDKTTPWCYLNHDSVILISKRGLEARNLITGEQTVLVGGNFKKFNTIEKMSDNQVFLSYNIGKKTHRSDDYDRHTAIGFYTLHSDSVYYPLKGKFFDKISISLNWSKCLIRSDKDSILLINTIKTSKANIHLADSIYDISDDGNYILYVKETTTNKASVNGLKKIRSSLPGQAKNNNVDTLAVLYLRDLTKPGPDLLVDTLMTDSTLLNNTTIYGRYSFHFNNRSNMFVYMKKIQKDSSCLVVRMIRGTQIVYQSVVPQDFVNPDRHPNFTDNYINVRNLKQANMNKNGIKLLNNSKRDGTYFLKLYKPDNSNVWKEEFNKVGTDLK
jgi:hypothetical protein